jgi:hypothetical protein
MPIDDRRRRSPILVPQFLSVTVSDQLSIDTCTYDKWLSGNVTGEQASATPLANETDAANTQAVVVGSVGDDRIMEDGVIDAAQLSRTSIDFCETLETIAVSAVPGKSVGFDYWTEPFSTIGPDGRQTPGQTKTFHAWFSDSGRFMARWAADHAGGYVPVVDFDGRIDSVAGQSPASEDSCPEIPTGEPSRSLTEASSPTASAPLIKRFVGCSPIIATIEEAYLPYDLADRDLGDGEPMRDPGRADGTAETTMASLVWADPLLSPWQTPFCIRSLAMTRESDWSPLAKNATANTSDQLPAGSADALLQNVIWQVGVALRDAGVTDPVLRPDRIGQQVALLVVSGDRLASWVARELALVWPVEAKPANPIPGIGARLLARAEAAERLRTESSEELVSKRQLARANAVLLQWVAVTQSVIDDLTHHLNDVTEVARNRGTQDESIRR